MLHISIYSIFLWMAAIFIASLDCVIFLGSRNSSSRLFAGLTFLVAIWSFSYGFLIASTTDTLPLILIKFQHLIGMIVSLGFAYFSLVYPDEKKVRREVSISMHIVALIFTILLFGTDLIIPGMFLVNNADHWGWKIGSLYPLYSSLFVVLWLFTVFTVYYKAQKCTDLVERKNRYYMFWALIFGVIPPCVMNIILPSFHVYGTSWAAPVVSALWVCIIAYSILKYRQMDVRAVVTEVLAIAMTAIFFLNIFIDTPFGIWGRIAAFLAFLILAYYLIRGVLREAKQREQLNDLNHNLEEKVAAQTVEIRRSLEAERRARMELEKLNDAKDQFIMITQHHLRTPVSSVNWSLESVLHGEYGAVTQKLKSVLEQTYESGKRLMRIVDDFLNIAAIKIGTNILNLEPQSLKPSIEDILAELKPAINSMGVSITWPSDVEQWPALPIDVSKMREALFIIFENAVRYNIRNGSIHITTKILVSEAGNRTFEIMVTNSGLGISRDDIDKIGTSLFYRSEFARKAYPIGMGVGLSVVKAMIHAHQGTFTIHSAGPGTGAQVTVTLPFERQAAF